MIWLILTAEQADLVRVSANPAYALDPRPLADGTYALPARIINVPEHAAHRDLLAALPQREVVEGEWLIEE